MKENTYKLCFQEDDLVIIITLKAKNRKEAIEKAKNYEKKIALENPVEIYRSYNI